MGVRVVNLLSATCLCFTSAIGLLFGGGDCVNLGSNKESRHERSNP